jgi:hypothetical protein
MGFEHLLAVIRGKLRSSHTKLNGNFGMTNTLKQRLFSKGETSALAHFIDATPIIFKLVHSLECSISN